MKIKYLKHHFGIQPGTVVDEPREAVVARLTKEESVLDDQGKRVQIPPIARLTDEPTTEDLEKAAAARAAKPKAQQATARGLA